MIEALQGRVNGDAGWSGADGISRPYFLLEVGQAAWLISILRGPHRLGDAGAVRDAVIVLRAARLRRGMAKFWSSRPPPGSHDLMALIKRRVLKAEGNLQVFMANLRYFKEALAKLRAAGGAA